jgi:hypothetical protein
MNPVDPALHIAEITIEYAKKELISQLKSLSYDCERALMDLQDGKRLPAMIIQNKVSIESNIAKYNLVLDLLPSLRKAAEVESEHGQQARDERGSSGGEPREAESDGKARPRARRKLRP